MHYRHVQYACTIYLHVKIKWNHYGFAVIFKTLSQRLIVSRAVKNHWAAFFTHCGWFSGSAYPITDQWFNLQSYKTGQKKEMPPKGKAWGPQWFYTFNLAVTSTFSSLSQLPWDLWLMIYHFLNQRVKLIF